MEFWCVDDRVPEITLRLLGRACDRRSIDFVRVDATAFNFATQLPLAPGSMLYRPAVSLAAMRVEQVLVGPGVATFYERATTPFFQPLTVPLLFERAGLPVPRTLPCTSNDRARLGVAVAVLGGLPIVIKVAGGEGGVGVLRVDSLAALYSTIDYLLAAGAAPLLSTWVADAVPWRVVVVGEHAIASYPMPMAEGDFRSTAVDDARFIQVGAPAELAAIAVAAVRTLGNEMGGVDLLWHRSGRVYLLEANFPCYFAPAEELAGIDVAGAMLDHLMAKARRLVDSTNL